MFVVMNRLQCAAAHGEALERAFLHAGNMEGVPGCLLFQFLKHVEQDGSLLYVALTQWENQAAFEAWRKSEAFAHAHQGPPASGTSPITSSTEMFEVLAGG
jgi:heme-degrading monooxygenase HmoA